MSTEVEVDPREGLAQDSGDRMPQQAETAQAQSPPPAQKPPENDDVIDILKPKAEQKQWRLVDNRNPNRVVDKTYVQKPLSYFQKMEFFGLVGEVIDKAVSGEDGLRLSSLFDIPGGGGLGNFSAEAFREADTFVQAVGKLLTYAPDFLQKCYVIWWSVPEHERPWAIEVMSRDEQNGGLSDKEGIEAIEIFIDQNWDALDAFFREEVPRLRDRVQARRGVESESQPSKPSNGTPESTPSQ